MGTVVLDHITGNATEELKLDKFKAEFKGQMELYLRWLTKHEQEPNEEAPIGLILCAGKSDEQVELLELEKSGIRVAEYMTELPPRKILEKKLHQAIQLARERLATIQRKSEETKKELRNKQLRKIVGRR